MKLYFHKHNYAHGEYSLYYIANEIEKSTRHQKVLNPVDADIVLMSVHAVDDITKLARLRKELPSVKILVGGAGFYMADLILLFANYLFCGHASSFFNEFETFADLDTHPNILHRRKYDAVYREITSAEIAEYPIFKEWRGVLCLAGVGCRMKCPFCAVGWHEKKTEHPHIEKLIELKSIFIKENEKRKRFRAVGFDFDDRLSYEVSRTYYTVQQYIKNYKHFKQDNSIHLNIETPNEVLRTFLGKPISHDEILEAISLTGRRQTVVLNFIGGFNHTYEFVDFLSLLPKEKMVGKHSCKVKYKLHLTPFLRIPYTPLEDYPLDRLAPVSIDRILRESKRMGMEIFNRQTAYIEGKPQASLRYSMCLNAKSMEDYKRVSDIVKRHGDDPYHTLTIIGHEGLDYMFSGTHKRKYAVKMPNENLLQKAKEDNQWITNIER